MPHHNQSSWAGKIKRLVRIGLTVGLIASAMLCSTALGEIRLPKIIGSNMVLQRESDVTIWGWADPGEKVILSGDWLDGELVTSAGDKGTWQITLKTGQAGGPHRLKIGNHELTDILFGEVWIASGQSNMEMPLVPVSGAYTGIENAQREVGAADFPEIRLFQTGNFSSREPLDDVQEGIVMYGVPKPKCRWDACTPETVKTFSSTAYFFARHLHRELKVPIGIIDSSWGGTSAETWTPRAGLEKLDYAAELEQAKTLPQKADQKIPTRLYNGMIHPLRKTRIRGVIWYQGEGNSGRADKYHQLFSTMIRQWRGVFEQEFSFYFVQLAPFNYRNINSAFLREAQFETMSLPKSGMAVTLDIGNLTDIHPKNKQEVGRRLALWALAKDYGKETSCSGPIYKSHQIDGQAIRIAFSHADDGLRTSDGEAPRHFLIAGEDGKYHAANAQIDGSAIMVHAPSVKSPKTVRYAFTNDPNPNLINKAGLPASSFRTDTLAK